ncbi:hypothetical protein V6N13_133700 [Hibiscus sabdariffa]|uniref:Uncharacterized protein n=1 Tax=Hibiscus sabdariffa TaxID=183260 RepID=A0ABR2R150_9ROSI
MDVFIPEEYVIRRRLEKKEAAIAEKRSKTVLEASQKQDMDSKSVPLLFGRPDGNGFLVSSGNSETISSEGNEGEVSGHGSEPLTHICRHGGDGIKDRVSFYIGAEATKIIGSAIGLESASASGGGWAEEIMHGGRYRHDLKI